MRLETADSIARTRVALKGPLETPVGFGEKSANVTLRKLFDANLAARSHFGFSAKFLKNGKVQGSSIYLYRLSTDLSTIVGSAPYSVEPVPI